MGAVERNVTPFAPTTMVTGDPALVAVDSMNLLKGQTEI